MRNFILTLIAVCFCVSAARAADDKMTADELIARHVASIGDAAARNAAKARGIAGPLVFSISRNGSGHAEGDAKYLSEGRKLHLMMSLNAATYSGEEFISDGDKTAIKGTISGGQRSQLGAFLAAQRPIIRDGLFGGVISTAWPLLDISATKATLRYNGLKTIDGRKLHELRYDPRKGDTDLQIKLYFDPETYRHVMTTYQATISSPQARTIDPRITSTNGTETQNLHVTLKETFSEFQTVDGLTLPQHWQLELVSDATERPIMDWEISVRAIDHRPFDPAAFKMP